ncbi:MAG: DEAD/DEAH box helicase [Atopobiaceae bacterium]|nr:DEAD/DEAH box helicase [Atopobiaceae bacterium]MCI1318909.1 DEAD/DEAH box helicase [Atopobiaceae bacterium]MCI1389376.1 DEAD/DEAH box helicase [Atopobiaceae bacterium]MCI1432439.1 DEAD/DEAH box helicase [Atopobiaceae bacterium]MCI1470897.1 DEAD/DEAH box helicase [Atopobiaceae bacterium]
MPDVFDRFAPFVQDFIYEHEWESLRGVQVAAAEAIFDTDLNVLLTSSTASGKTEAAFFPILTELWQDPPSSVGCIYVGPLKALINDQFYRLTDLCAEAGVNVWHWHGDVSASHKARLMKSPSGILQITPESLEAMLLHRHAAIPRLFCDLRYVVIDEVHSLMRGDRGAQTLCLIERLQRLANVRPRRIGLSATIGDPEAAAQMLSAGSGRGCVVPRVSEPGQTWRISMEHFFVSGPQASEEGRRETAPGAPVAVDAIVEEPAATAGLPEEAGAAPEVEAPPVSDAAQSDGPEAGEAAPANADPGIGYVYEHTAGRKCLVFTNSREECEAVCSTLRSYCEHEGKPDRFLIHHGNLSQSFRESAEELMRDDELDLTTCTTSTLELGIDIGRLERAFQIDAPFTVSSFLQRMGRTGRRGQPPEMWFVMREEQPEPRALLTETIPWKLLQGIALVQLYLEDRWVEPPRQGRLRYSLLYHQTMAMLASTGEMSPAELASRVLTLSPFANVSLDDYRLLLRHLLETDEVERTEEGGLIVGLAGERVTNDFRFYGVFVESEEYAVRCESQELGTVVMPPPAGEKLAIAGRVWLVEEVDHKRRLVYVTEVKGKVPAYFGECPGDIDTHVLERMRGVLRERRDYPYLRENARARLAHARRVAEAAHIDTDPLVSLGGTSWALLPWLGTYSFLALERVIKRRMPKELGIKGIDVSRPYFMQFQMSASPEEFLSALVEAALSDFDPMELLFPGEVPVFDKYDEFLPEELVRKGFAYGVLDVEGMRARVGEWTGEFVSEATPTLGPKD